MSKKEVKTLQKSLANINKAICAATGYNPQPFGDQLVAKELISTSTVNNILSTGEACYNKVSKLVNAVLTLLEIGSQNKAEKDFRAFLEILCELNLGDQAKKMEEDCYGPRPVKVTPILRGKS